MAEVNFFIFFTDISQNDQTILPCFGKLTVVSKSQFTNNSSSSLSTDIPAIMSINIEDYHDVMKIDDINNNVIWKNIAVVILKYHGTILPSSALPRIENQRKNQTYLLVSDEDFPKVKISCMLNDHILDWYTNLFLDTT